MSFVHCSKCDFSQDDFWYERYNPIQSIGECEYIEKIMVEGKLDDPLEGWDLGDMCAEGLKPNPTRKEFILWTFGQYITRIEQMHWATKEEYMASDKKCPKCGAGMVED